MSKEEVRVFEKLKAISHRAPLKEKIRVFEAKYGSTFEGFERQLKSEPEDFEQWDCSVARAMDARRINSYSGANVLRG